MENPVKTLVVDNFNGFMTAYQDGDINSGYSNVFQTYGNNRFVAPGNLTWYNDTEQIDAAGAVITDLIMAAKERVESNILYVYAIGHTGRLYKIQVNDPTTFNPDYDNPVLLTTLVAESPTFTRGGFMDFYGATEKIYIGHDKGVTSVNFDGTGEAVVGVAGSWTQNVPRPLEQFIGKLYIGNGSNIAEVDTTATVTSYTKLSPGFPTNTQVRDLDTSSEGTYLDIVVSRLAMPDITTATQDTTSVASTDGYIFKWNGTDTGYTAFTTFPSFSLTANTMFRNYQYVFGSDLNGSAIFNPSEKLITEPEVQPAMPNAVISSGNVLTWMAPLYFEGNLYGLQNNWGSLDHEVGTAYWTSVVQTATSPETDVIQVPMQIMVSNFGLGSSSNGYANNLFGTAKTYFSTLETSSGPTIAYRLYKWSPIPSPTIEATNVVPGVYQTQSQIFSKKVSIKSVRVYGNPWVANNEFTIDLVGSDGTPMAGASKTFTVGSNITVGDDYTWFTPQCKPSYCVALRISNSGTTNHVITKAEIDYSIGGQ